MSHSEALIVALALPALVLMLAGFVLWERFFDRLFIALAILCVGAMVGFVLFTWVRALAVLL